MTYDHITVDLSDEKDPNTIRANEIIRVVGKQNFRIINGHFKYSGAVWEHADHMFEDYPEMLGFMARVDSEDSDRFFVAWRITPQTKNL